MKRAIQTGFEGAHSLSSVDAELEFLLAFFSTIPVRWVTSPQPSADRPRKDGRWPVHRPTPLPEVSDGGVGATVAPTNRVRRAHESSILGEHA